MWGLSHPLQPKWFIKSWKRPVRKIRAVHSPTNSLVLGYLQKEQQLHQWHKTSRELAQRLILLKSLFNLIEHLSTNQWVSSSSQTGLQQLDFRYSPTINYNRKWSLTHKKVMASAFSVRAIASLVWTRPNFCRSRNNEVYMVYKINSKTCKKITRISLIWICKKEKLWIIKTLNIKKRKIVAEYVVPRPCNTFKPELTSTQCSS